MEPAKKRSKKRKSKRRSKQKYKFSSKYIPEILSIKDKKKQSKMLSKSINMYNKGKYYIRKKLSSYKSKKSRHLSKASKLYKIKNISPNKKLAKATGCSIIGMKKIINKGEGAYYSSGSRPNQTPKSWGLARLASSLTGGNASLVDYKILEKYCNHNKKAFLLANKLKKSKI